MVTLGVGAPLGHPYAPGPPLHPWGTPTRTTRLHALRAYTHDLYYPHPHYPHSTLTTPLTGLPCARGHPYTSILLYPYTLLEMATPTRLTGCAWAPLTPYTLLPLPPAHRLRVGSETHSSSAARGAAVW